MSKYPNLGAEIKRRDMTIKDFAAEVGVSTNTVANWLSGRSEPGIETAKGLSEKLGVTVDYLFSTEPIAPSV